MIIKTVKHILSRLVKKLCDFQIFLYDMLFGSTIVIHTPRCSGTYVRKQYFTRRQFHTRWVGGHNQFRSLKLYPKQKVVALIRNPLDWYLSNYYYIKHSLAKETFLAEAQLSNFSGIAKNYPPSHPISVFSKNTELSFEDMISNMNNNEFLSGLIQNRVTAHMHNRDIYDVFSFMKRTECGFYSWAMIYYLSKRETKDINAKKDVVQEAQNISEYVKFIHQENIDSDVERYLGFKRQKGDRLNESFRPSKRGKLINEKTGTIIRELDGEVAFNLGGYYSKYFRATL